MTTFTQTDTAVQRAILAAGGSLPWVDDRSAPGPNSLQDLVDANSTLSGIPLDKFFVRGIYDAFNPPESTSYITDAYGIPPANPPNDLVGKVDPSGKGKDAMMKAVHLAPGMVKREELEAANDEDSVAMTIEKVEESFTEFLKVVVAEGDKIIMQLDLGANNIKTPAAVGIPGTLISPGEFPSAPTTPPGIGAEPELMKVIVKWLIEYIPPMDARLLATPPTVL